MNDETEIQAPVNLVDLMDMLVEPPEPQPVSMLPQTGGWVVLGILLALALCWAIWRGVKHWRANAYRRAALVELSAAGDDPAVIAAILRRAALAAWPRARVAGLTGADWLGFLDASGGSNQFRDGPGAALARAPYSGEQQVPGLSKLAADWVRAHRVEAAP